MKIIDLIYRLCNLKYARGKRGKKNKLTEGIELFPSRDVSRLSQLLYILTYVKMKKKKKSERMGPEF